MANMNNERQILAVIIVIFIIISSFTIIGLGVGLFSNPFVSDTTLLFDISDQSDKSSGIFFPFNNSVAYDTVNVTVVVRCCNCTGVTKLYINGDWYSNGSRASDIMMIDFNWMEVFYHPWNTTEFEDGFYVLEAYGKHDEFVDKIMVTVRNKQ